MQWCGDYATALVVNAGMEGMSAQIGKTTRSRGNENKPGLQSTARCNG
jgi:hypothetical protein